MRVRDEKFKKSRPNDSYRMDEKSQPRSNEANRNNVINNYNDDKEEDDDE